MMVLNYLQFSRCCKIYCNTAEFVSRAVIVEKYLMSMSQISNFDVTVINKYCYLTISLWKRPYSIMHVFTPYGYIHMVSLSLLSAIYWRGWDTCPN